jgi:hypothetical protein
MQQEIDQLEGHHIDAACAEGEAEPPRIRGDATDARALRAAQPRTVSVLLVRLAEEITRQGRLQRCGRCVE